MPTVPTFAVRETLVSRTANVAKTQRWAKMGYCSPSSLGGIQLCYTFNQFDFYSFKVSAVANSNIANHKLDSIHKIEY